MAATGRAASKKAEVTAYNLGDEGFYEDDGAGLDEDYYYRQMKAQENREKNKVYKREPTAKELKEKAEAEEFERKKAQGLLHVTPDTLALMAAEEARLKEKKKAERIAQIEEEEKRKRLEELRLEKIRMKKYKKSSEYKRKCWEEKRKERLKHDAKWEVIEKNHKDKEAEYRAAKELFDRQRRIDESWQRKKPEASPSKQAQPKPQPKPKGKKGKTVDLSKYAGILPAAAMAKKQEPDENAEVNLPWDTKKGEKDPNRPAAEKQAEQAAWERKQKAWKKHQEDWSKQKQEHNKEVQRFTEQGLYESEPEFHTDPDTDEEGSSESDSDSDF